IPLRMLILCIIFILFLPPSLLNCTEVCCRQVNSYLRLIAEQEKYDEAAISEGTAYGYWIERESRDGEGHPLLPPFQSNRDDSTHKSWRRKRKHKIKVGPGARARSINQAMHDDRFPIASPSPLRPVYIKELPTPRKEKLGEKELAILHGAKCRNTDYPTMADIESDWDD
ncbi:hypothetical protein PMAYCL1PPCAC_12168, partial [Pristionchus mayeri]